MQETRKKYIVGLKLVDQHVPEPVHYLFQTSNEILLIVKLGQLIVIHFAWTLNEASAEVPIVFKHEARVSLSVIANLASR